tara:strand:- start:631 stop:1581 length:951 start_codon:yes stop_codon:yes gene_type:complete
MIKRVVLIVFIGLLYSPFCSFAQDSIPGTEDIVEGKILKFQEYFFKALSEKSIRNYKKAIENLEVCNDLLPKNKTIYFEFSKNYLFLNKIPEAKEYIDRALSLEPDNIWMLQHLVSIEKRDRNYEAAIKTQLKIVVQNPKQRTVLVSLYYLHRDYTKAMYLLNTLEQEGGLNKNLKQLKYSLELRKGPLVKKETREDLPSLIRSFENNQTSFSNLKKLLEIAIKSDTEAFDTYSKRGIELFPAQPYIYLSRGKSLQMQKKHNEAIDILESGIDFVIDNPTLEGQFYTMLANAYLSINNNAKATEYLQKAKKIKNIE